MLIQLFRVLSRDSRIQISIVLLLVWFFALIVNPGWEFLVFPLLVVFFTIAFDLFLTKIKGKNLHLPSSSIVTGLLLGLILFPFENPVIVIFAPLVAVLSKHFLRFNNRHLFNPASMGIVVTSLVFRVSVSWWAVAVSRQQVLIILLAGGYVLWRLRRLWLPVTFLVVYGLYLGMLGNMESLIPLLFDGTVFFFSFVMLPEPMTSPYKDGWRFLWGPAVVAILIIYQQLGFSFSDLFLLSLLTANAIWGFWRIFG